MVSFSISDNLGNLLVDHTNTGYCTL